MEHLTDFIDKQFNQPEPGLIIADGDKVELVQHELHASSYTEAVSFQTLFDLLALGHHVYWHYKSGDFQLMYSFLAQYSGGMAELYDTNEAVTYQGNDLTAGFIIIMSAVTVQELTQQYSLLERVGMSLNVNS